MDNGFYFFNAASGVNPCHSTINITNKRTYSVALGLLLGSQSADSNSFFSWCNAMSFSFICFFRSAGGTNGAGGGGGVFSNNDTY